MTLTEEQLGLFGAIDVPAPPTGHAATLPLAPADARGADPLPQRKMRQVSMLGSYADARVTTLVPDPPEYQGWQEEMGGTMPRIVRGECTEVRRPCPHTTCRLHLLLDVDEVTGAVTLNDGNQHRLGRPPSLTQQDDDAEAADFVRRALARNPELEASCSRDVAEATRRRGTPLTEAEVGSYLGVSHETVRLDMVSIAMKLRALAAEGGFNLLDENADPADGIAAIAEALQARAKATPPLVQIRRRPR